MLSGVVPDVQYVTVAKPLVRNERNSAIITGCGTSADECNYYCPKSYYLLKVHFSRSALDVLSQGACKFGNRYGNEASITADAHDTIVSTGPLATTPRIRAPRWSRGCKAWHSSFRCQTAQRFNTSDGPARCPHRVRHRGSEAGREHRPQRRALLLPPVRVRLIQLVPAVVPGGLPGRPRPHQAPPLHSAGERGGCGRGTSEHKPQQRPIWVRAADRRCPPLPRRSHALHPSAISPPSLAPPATS
jgi:hypothetical protein